MKKKKKETRGRKTEGRERMVIHLLPAARAKIEAELSGRGDTPGRALERKYGVT